tara:strand:- start:51 stop:239 length:189 start_codon:yes stop_codon:yes gene_type:complete
MIQYFNKTQIMEGKITKHNTEKEINNLIRTSQQLNLNNVTTNLIINIDIALEHLKPNKKITK